jgi:hypothetical protein
MMAKAVMKQQHFSSLVRGITLTRTLGQILVVIRSIQIENRHCNIGITGTGKNIFLDISDVF